MNILQKIFTDYYEKIVYELHPRQAIVENVDKMIPNGIDMTIDKALTMSAELRQNYQQDSVTKQIIDTARSLEGLPRNVTMHPAGVVITDRPVSDYVPLSMSSDGVVTQYTMTTLEELGLLKMDVRLVR